MKVLIVLGSPNSETGDLGQVALDRLEYCFDIFESKDNCIICTGGFGEHFNTAPLPHADYAIKYLKESKLYILGKLGLKKKLRTNGKSSMQTLAER